MRLSRSPLSIEFDGRTRAGCHRSVDAAARVALPRRPSSGVGLGPAEPRLAGERRRLCGERPQLGTREVASRRCAYHARATAPVWLAFRETTS